MIKKVAKSRKISIKSGYFTIKSVENKDFMPIVTKSSNIGEKAQKNLLSLFLVGGTNLDSPYLTEILKKHNFEIVNEDAEILKEIIADEEASILMTSHIQDEIQRKMDFVGVMDGGRVVEFGETLDVFTEKEL